VPPSGLSWAGDVHCTFTPELELLQLQALRIKERSDWDDGSDTIDGEKAAEWFFQLQECSYGVLRILCPAQPHPILVSLYGKDYMTPALCHHCRNQAVEHEWSQMLQEHHWLEAGKVLPGARAGEPGVVVDAARCV